jgi:hypothetical protein
MHDDPMTPQASPQASPQDETIHVTPQVAPVPAVDPADVAPVEPVRAGGRSLMPFGLAAAVAGLGIAAVAVAAAASGPAAGSTPTIPQGMSLVSGASPSPAQDGQNGQGGQNGQNGWAGPGGGRGMMGGGLKGGRVGGPRGDVSVASISGSQLSLSTEDGWTRTIDASGATITRGGSAATLGDITVGSQIDFAETRNADGTYTITKIDIEMPRVAGTVTATGGSTITLKAMDGTIVTVTVTSATTYRMAGATSATLADIKVGDIVMATGTKAADGSLTATSVDAFAPGAGGPGAGGRPGWNNDRNGRHGQPGQNGPNPTPTPVPGA